jgi:ribonuclease-3
MLINIIDRLRLPFRKDKELLSSLYHIIGFYPHDISYYKMALMHKSVMHRNKKGKPVNNERLEFLGDAILDAAVGDIVYRHFPGKREGFLTNTRSKLVQRDTLNKLAKDMGISDLILSNGHTVSHNNYMGGNAFEALVGAMYLDRGFNACMHFLKKRILSQMINIDKVAYKEVNFKSKLIEWSQKNKVQMQFALVKEGKDENGSPFFSYRVVLEGIDGCEGTGFSKKESQQNASKDTLDKLRKKPQFIEEIFAAKANRTKMEEEPVQALPDTEGVSEPAEAQVVAATESAAEPLAEEAAQTAPVFHEEVFTETEAATPAVEEPETVSVIAQEADDEYDLSDISAKAKSREEIIAAAEQAAFAEGRE